MPRTTEEKKAYAKEYYIKHRAELLQYQKEYKAENPCIIQQRSHNYYAKNKERIDKQRTLRRERLKHDEKHKEVVARRRLEQNKNYEAAKDTLNLWLLRQSPIQKIQTQEPNK